MEPLKKVKSVKSAKKEDVIIEEKILETNKIKKGMRFHPFYIIVFVIVLTSLSFGGYFFYKYKKLQNDPSHLVKQMNEDLLQKVARLYLIPTGEEPTIAVIEDPATLKNQAFFSASARGDNILIFKQAGKAVLYRPSIDKIIEVAPINQNDQTPKQPEKTSEPLKDKTF